MNDDLKTILVKEFGLSLYAASVAAELAAETAVQAVLLEREECAKLCDPEPDIKYSPNTANTRKELAAAIRGR